MKYSVVATLAVLSMSALAVAPSGVRAAAISSTRLDNLPHVCTAGPLKGTACDDPADCDDRPCGIAFERASGFSAILTLIVDDDVSKFDDSEDVPNVIAVTALLEVNAKGKDIHAQTYQNLSGQTLAELIESLQQGPEIGSNVGQSRTLDEDDLNSEAANEADLIDAFLFQEGDTVFANALRTQLGKVGVPVITGISSIEHFDHQADGRASVVRVRVKGRFFTP